MSFNSYMEYFRFFEQDDIDKRVVKRPGETKLGECVKLGFEGDLAVVIGIPESIGVVANYGKAGTESLWPSFLDSFLNVHQQEKLMGNEISILGDFDFSSLIPEEGVEIKEWRKTVEKIDAAVFGLVRDVFLQGKLPIIIGGGHNNSYPIIKAAALGLSQYRGCIDASVNVLNLDAHADFRKCEGRHSGNGFRYAFDEGYLDKYAVLGLSENYNSKEMLQEMRGQSRIDFVFWEDIYLREALGFEEAIQRGVDFVEEKEFGVELDLDVVGRVLSSAMDPVGVLGVDARKYVYQVARRGKSKVAYLHVCEGATVMSDGKMDVGVAKLVSYLVTDFVKSIGAY
ncbi:formimidoylglutamase [Echinicola marina]|uniref:formimidoylglutamase n=1 Tax=Echinicola marina TaxID=2859768 RepID=UPI001CF6AD25|nr:formimidoylglutamase [Echinicola marina]UCS93638.1 formimidoylglutamase [Echinicola marina]